MATVDSNGVVTGVSAGTATITAISIADTTKTASKTITVPIPNIDSVSIDGYYSIWVGQTASFSATVTGTNVVQTVQWSSSNPSVATVDLNGVVRGVSAGTVAIMATPASDTTQTASKVISIIPVQTNNIARSADVTTTVTNIYGTGIK